MSPNFSPRPESAPVSSWDELSKDQQTAIGNIHQLLAEFLKTAPKPALPESSGKPAYKQFVSNLFSRRPSNVLLIDGGRGTGKTTVMLTLLKLWEEAIASVPNGLFDSLPEAHPTKVSLDGKQLVPLEILDMQPLTGHPSLLLQLAGRLYRVVEQLQPDGEALYLGRERKPAWSPDAEEQTESLREWDRFAYTVAVGTEDSPIDRKGKLNPEAFAIELEQSERLRTRLQERWQAFVNSLYHDLVRYRERVGLPHLSDDPCFIIPIDDADMNPERGIELLNLVRSLWHPRVVFLLTGDSALFRERLASSYERAPCKLPPVTARKLARDALGKIVPPVQRLRMRMTGSEAFRLRHGQVPPLLQALFDRHAFLKAALPSRWRVMRDLEQLWQAEPNRLYGAARVMLEESVYDAALSQENQDLLLKRVVQWYQESEQLEVYERYLTLGADQEWTAVPIDTKRSYAFNSTIKNRVALRRNDKDSTSEADEPLSESVTAALYLVSSIASQAKTGRHGIELSPTSYPTAVSTFKLPSVFYNFPWPVPQWVDPLDFRQFLQEWERVIQLVTEQRFLHQQNPTAGTESAQQTQNEILAAYFIHTICRIAGNYVTEGPLPPLEFGNSVDWEHIGVQIAALAKRQMGIIQSENSYVEWAQTEAMFFAAKESGLNSKSRSKIIDGWLYTMGIPEENSDDYWKMVARIAAGRARRFAIAIDQKRSEMTMDQQVETAIGAIDMGFYSTADAKTAFRSSRKEGLDSAARHIMTSIDFMSPECEDTYVERVRTYKESTTFHGLFFGHNHTKEQVENNHYVAHARLYASRLMLKEIPGELPSFWRTLWSRIQIEANELFYKQSTLLKILRSADASEARQAWQAVIETHVQHLVPGESGKVGIVRDFLASLEKTGDQHPIIQYLPRIQTPKQVGNSSTYKLKDSQDDSQFEFILTGLPELVALFSLTQQTQKLLSRVFEIYHDIVVDESNSMAVAEEVLFPAFEWHVDIEITSAAKWPVAAFPVPMPNWASVIDHILSLRSYSMLRHDVPSLWTNTGDDIISELGVPMPEGMAYCFVALFFTVAYERRQSRSVAKNLEYITRVKEMRNRTHDIEPISPKNIFWDSVKVLITNFYRQRRSGRRWATVRSWADLGAPLFAAPENGMDSGAAEKWLRSWDSTPHSINQLPVRLKLKESRRRRAAAALKQAGKPAGREDVESLIRQIDEEFADHAWVTLVENQSSDQAV